MGVDADLAPTTPYDSWLDLRCAERGRVARARARGRARGDLRLPADGQPRAEDPVVEAPRARTRSSAPSPGSRPAATWPGGWPGSRATRRSSTRPTCTSPASPTSARARGRSALPDALDVPAERASPRIVEPTDVIGELTAEAAADSGLAAGTPIAAGLGDTAAGTLGAGVVRPGQLLDIAGTAAILAGSVAEFRPDVRRAHADHDARRGARAVGVARLSLRRPAARVARRPAARRGVRRARSPAATPSRRAAGLERLAAEAAAVPPARRGCCSCPTSTAGSCPASRRCAARGSGCTAATAAGISPAPSSRASRSSTVRYLDVLTGLHPDLAFAETRVAGGGARSEVWCGLKASALGVPYARLGRGELSCWGAALVAGAAVGVFDDLARRRRARRAPHAGRIEPGRRRPRGLRAAARGPPRVRGRGGRAVPRPRPAARRRTRRFWR